MPARERVLLGACAALVLLHAVSWMAPGTLWSLSHLVVWPRAVALGWTLAAFAGLVAAARFAGRGGGPRFPMRRGAHLGMALVAALLFYVCRERLHLFGDGALLSRSLVRGETTPWRAPGLVVFATSLARLVAPAGVSTATMLATLSVVLGAATVYALLRLAARLGTDGPARALFAVLFLTAGTAALYFGHVELYAPFALAVVVWLHLALGALRTGAGIWIACVAFGGLVALHLSAIGLLPAVAFLAARGVRGRERWLTLAALGAAVAVVWATFQAAATLRPFEATQTAGALQRFFTVYFDSSDNRHAYGFASLGHALALTNELLLLAPLALVGVAGTALPLRRGMAAVADDPVLRRFANLAAIGAFLFAAVLPRDLGAYRDWDTLAAYAPVYLLAAGLALVHAGLATRRSVAVLAVAGLHHLVPWIALQVFPARTLEHIHIALAAPRQWSPYARGYFFEDLAIDRRERGDLLGALREYEAAIAADPADARYQVGAGNVAGRLGDLERAVRYYEAALVRRPDYPPAHINLASALANLGVRLDEARRHALVATRARPDDFSFQLTLGFVEMQRGDFEAAQRAFETAGRLQPGSAKVRERLEELRALRQASEALSPRGP